MVKRFERTGSAKMYQDIGDVNIIWMIGCAFHLCKIEFRRQVIIWEYIGLLPLDQTIRERPRFWPTSTWKDRMRRTKTSR